MMPIRKLLPEMYEMTVFIAKMSAGTDCIQNPRDHLL